MPPVPLDDQALRLFRVAHADLSYRAPTEPRLDDLLAALVTRVIEDNQRAEIAAALSSSPTVLAAPRREMQRQRSARIWAA